MRRLLLSATVLIVAMLQTIVTSASAQNASVTKALDQPMLAGGSFAVSPCSDFADLFNGIAEQQQGKAKANEARMALFGWFEGYMEGFRIAISYTRPDMLANLTGLNLTKIMGELKDYCTLHRDWTLILAAARVSLQIAQDGSGRYK